MDRHFDTWYIRDADDKPHTVEVRLRQSDAAGPYYFQAFCTEPRFDARDDDPNKLKETVRQMLVGVQDAEWEPWLLICVKEPEKAEPPDKLQWQCDLSWADGVAFAVYTYDRAVRADGSVYWRYERRATAVGTDDYNIVKGDPKELLKKHKKLGQLSTEWGYAAIPDSEETRAKLKLLEAAFVQLRKNISEFINKPKLAERLAAWVPGQLQLPAPKDEPHG